LTQHTQLLFILPDIELGDFWNILCMFLATQFL